MKEDRVLIDVLVVLLIVGVALAQDNELRVKGWLQVYRAKLNLERESLMAAAIGKLEAHRAEERNRFTGKALQDAERGHTRRVRALLNEDRLHVRVGQVELVSGTMVNNFGGSTEQSSGVGRWCAFAPRRPARERG